MRRQQIITALTMVVLIGFLVFAATWGWRALFAEIPSDETVAEEPTATCTPQEIKAGQKIRARQVRVSVFNGGTRSGLAGDTLDALTNRGFKAGDVGNAPSDLNVGKVKVLAATKDDIEARLVARQFGKKTKVTVSERDLGPGVDVLVGDKFKRLAKAQRSLTVKSAQEVCVPVAAEDAGQAS